MARLLRLLEEGVPEEAILVLAPHRPLAEPYFRALRPAEPSDLAGQFDQPESSIVTIAGLAQRAVRRFWSIVAGPAGFANPRAAPVFINHETAQYVMALVVRPLLAQGYFESVAVGQGRLPSQILDNLNRAAGAGFPYTEIARRLKAAWTGDPSQLRAFDSLQECAIRFRQFCLAHNLLDFSLLLEVFASRLWPDPQVQDLLGSQFQHLIADNLEEDVAVTHDILRSWLPRFASALLIYDQEAGYRTLLGADPETAYGLKDACDASVTLEESFVIGPEVGRFVESLFSLTPERQPPSPSDRGEIREVVETHYEVRLTPPASRIKLHATRITYLSRFFPQMLDWAAAQAAELVHQSGIAPGEIAVLAPSLGDALLFSLTERLEREGVPARSFRPSRPLRDDPAVPCLLALAGLAHPGWYSGAGALAPTRFDLAYALVQAIEGMDLVRAQLLAEIVYRLRSGSPILTPFEAIRPDMQERITYALGGSYQTLWEWLEIYRSGEMLDLDEFWRKLLEEVLLQPGFRFAGSPAARRAAENLIDSARNFRLAVASPPQAQPARAGRGATPAQATRSIYPGERPLGLEFTQLIQEGIAPAQYLRGWQEPEEEAVLIAPAYTFLFANRPVDVQIWLDVGSRAWGERLFQPLTHPYVLARGWPEGRPWTDQDEVETGERSLYRLALGLARRCRRSIFTGASQLSERGYPQEGPLWRSHL
jgi:hypothetical protein